MWTVNGTLDEEEASLPAALLGWEAKLLCLGADRGKAHIGLCADYVEVPPGVLQLILEDQGDSLARLDILRAPNRSSIATGARTKLLAYWADTCLPEAEAFFNAIAEDVILTSLGAVEALGACYGSHPELQRSFSFPATGDPLSALAEYRFVMGFEKSATSDRLCPVHITGTTFHALLQGAVPIIWGPADVATVLNPSAVIQVNSTIPLPSWRWSLRDVVHDMAGVENMAVASALLPDAAALWFSWDLSLHGHPTSLTIQAVNSTASLMKGSPHQRCVAYAAWDAAASPVGTCSNEGG